MGFGSSGVSITELHFQHLFGQLTEALLNGDFSNVVDIAVPVLWPMFVGSFPTALCIWTIFYLPLNRIVKSYQKRRGKQCEVNKINLVGDTK